MKELKCDYSLEPSPTQDSSHHQDYEPFLGSGIPNYVTGILGSG